MCVPINIIYMYVFSKWSFGYHALKLKKKQSQNVQTEQLSTGNTIYSRGRET